jgi:translation initiation factor 3 subunit G
MSVSSSSAPSKGRLNWADADGDDESRSGEKGLRTVTEMMTNEKGQKLRVTRKLKSVLKPVKVNRHVMERRKWAKFGDCEGLIAGPETNVTYTSFEVINLDLRPKKREEEKEEGALDKLQGSSSIVVCRNCKRKKKQKKKNKKFIN